MNQTPMTYLQKQGRLAREQDAQRQAMADRLGISVDRLRTLTAASALRPGVVWRLS